jgi:NSS family neurotransmitter:Na+ symporter
MIEKFDKFSSSFLMPIGAFFISIFVGWKMKKADILDEISNSKKLKIKYFNLFLFLIKYFVPLAIITTFLSKL